MTSRAPIKRLAQAIGPNEMLISAQALASECVLVTANVDEFSRVANLTVENWLDTPE